VWAIAAPQRTVTQLLNPDASDDDGQASGA
jgi:hypothetical protein